jgi:hypothetical protein
MASYAGIGARLTPPEILTLMREVAGALASRGYCLRTGGADGADQAFYDGAVGLGEQVELFLPWPGFHGWRARGPGVRLFERPTPEAYRLAEQYHPNWRNVRRGPRSLHARNVHIVLGPNLDEPVRLICCWTPAGELVGGTAQALRIAAHHNIPVFNLADPMTRQRVLSSIRGPHAQNARTGEAQGALEGLPDAADIMGGMAAGGAHSA